MPEPRTEQDAFAQVKAHYDRLLGDAYTWMRGGFEANRDALRDRLARAGVTARPGDVALDLGCGTGFHAVALADAGFSVRAVDASARCLAELVERAGSRPVEALLADLADPTTWAVSDASLAVCMGDTLPHLGSVAAVRAFLDAAAGCLRPGGELWLELHELTEVLTGDDRFAVVRSEADRILTSFLEDAGETVVVHDLLHTRGPSGWTLEKSHYAKVRLPWEVLEGALSAAGLDAVERDTSGRLVFVRARPDAALYHVVRRSELRAGLDGDAYTPARFAADGFVHCAPRRAALSVADDYFADADEPVVILRVGRELLTSRVADEAPAPLEGGGRAHLEKSRTFPHVYGPLDRAAITGAALLERRAAGGHSWPRAFLDLADVL